MPEQVHPPRLCRLRYYLCCALAVLVFALIYFGNMADRLPWESSPGKKSHKSFYTWPQTAKSDSRNPSHFSKNKYQRQKDERLKMFSLTDNRLQKSKSRESQKQRLGLGMDFSEERPTFFKRKDDSLRKNKGLWMEDRFPPRQSLPLELQDTQRKSELAKETPSPPLKTQALGLKNQISPPSGDLWKKNEPSVLKTKKLGLKKETAESVETSREKEQLFFPKRPRTGLKNSIQQIPRNPWRENVKPVLKNQTLGFKNKLPSSSESLWKKAQNLWQKTKMVGTPNQGPFSRNKTRVLLDKLSLGPKLPWKTPSTQAERKEMRDRLGILYSRSKEISGRKDTTAQKPRKYNRPDDWPEFFEPRNQQQFSLEYHYRYQARSACRPPVDMLVMVLSAPKNKLRRQAIRDTWGSVVRTRTWPGPSPQTLPKTLGVVFLLGEEKQLGSNVSEAVKEESKRYGDVVQWQGLRNTAFNRTMKVILGLKWVALYCSQVSHVIKAEDDTFVHVPRLLQALLSAPQAPDLIWGFQVLKASSTPLTTRAGKNAPSPEAYPFTYFPPYLKGGLYVLPGNAVSRMIAAAPYLPYNNMEDVHVTGTLALALGMRHEPFATKAMLVPRVVGDPCLFQRAKRGLVRVQIKAPSFVYRIWSKISDPRACGQEELILV